MGLTSASSRRRVLPVLASFLLAALLATSAAAQTSVRATDGTTPLALSPGSPAGSYPLSGFESVNLYNGGLSFALPLAAVGGRGETGASFVLPFRQTWAVTRQQYPSADGFIYLPTQHWWATGAAAAVPSVASLNARHATAGSINCPSVGAPVAKQTLTRVTFTAPDGTEYEMVDRQTGGRPHSQVCTSSGFSRGKEFVTTDGSSATFIADAPVADSWMAGDNISAPVAGVVILRDGTRYVFGAHDLSQVRDRNGNRVTFGPSGQSATDSLGRQVTVTGAQGYRLVTYPGFGGTTRTVRIDYANLGSLLRTTRPSDVTSPRTERDLFPELGIPELGGWDNPYDPQVVSSVTLPDGQRKYRFFYNEYAELARVELPTGGAVEYDYGPGITNKHASGAVNLGPAFGGGFDWHVYRRVTERRVYPDGSTLGGKTTYGRPETVDSSYAVQTLGYVTVEQRDASGGLLSSQRHYFYGSAAASLKSGLSQSLALSYPGWKEGREYRTELYSAAGALLRRESRTWAQPAAGTTWPLAQAETSDTARPNDPRVIETLTTLADADRVSRRAYAYDRFGNVTDVYEYDFGAAGSGVAGPLLRRTHTDFETATAYVEAGADPASGAGLRSLPRRQWVSSDAAGDSKLLLTAYAYDQFEPEPCPGIVGHDGSYGTGFDTRGNLTGMTRYANAAAETGGVTTAMHYDIAGNAVSATDANGHTTYVSYADNFSDGNNLRHAYAFPKSTLTAAPNPSSVPNPDGGTAYAAGTFGSTTGFTTYTEYDFNTGLVTSETDANGQTTSYGYADPLDRLKEVTRPDGGVTQFYYGDAAGDLHVRTLTSLDGARKLESRRYFDGLGRAYRAATFENSVAAEPWLHVDTAYDAVGRVSRVSTPYRSNRGGLPLSPLEWSGVKGAETVYDALGRVTKVTAADGAAVTTSYAGNAVTVTDPAGRKRRSVSDALGRLVRMDEPHAATGALDGSDGNPVQPTHYTYDALGNLREVEQGGQKRFFMYDSLGRLIRARNPEQGTHTRLTQTDAVNDALTNNQLWSVAYGYDANGNLTSRVDARNVETTYAYDRLDRNILTSYAGGTPDTPTVLRRYDFGVGGKGRPYQVAQGGSTTSAAYFDEYDAAGRPLVMRQRFETAGVWSPDYEVRAEYNPAGGITRLTYPSGRRVEYRYDDAGRLGDEGGRPAFEGTLGGGAVRAYASEVLYDRLGGMEQERFGTQTPLYHKRFYNPRGQLGEIRLGLHPITNADEDIRSGWERGAVINHYGKSGWGKSSGGAENDRNLRQQDVFIPKVDGAGYDQGGNFDLFVQKYEYDRLNRLTRAGETWGGVERWAQVYKYDRWGNRAIDSVNSYVVPQPRFDVDPATNRLGVPAGQAGQMAYDAAGNLTLDTYQGGQGGGGARAYDAENRMTSAGFVSGQAQTASYVYDGDGRRVRRLAGTPNEAWQVYGMGGELLAEYAPHAPSGRPSKEYGYRGGELLVTAEPGAAPAAEAAGERKNVALPSNGGVAVAVPGHPVYPSPSYSLAAINDGDRRVQGGVWADSTSNVYPDWVQLDFSGAKAVDEVAVFSVPDGGFATPGVEPTQAMTGSQYVVSAFEVQYRTGSGVWATIPGGVVTGNNLIWRRVTFPEVVTTGVRLKVSQTGDNYSQVPEVEVWGRDASVPRANHALMSGGATATASSQVSANYPAAAAIDGDRRGLNYGSGGAWVDGTQSQYPDWLEVDLGGERRVDEVQFFGVQEAYASPAEPSEAMTSRFAPTDFEVQYRSGASWVTVQGGAVSGNDRVWRRLTFPEVATRKVRVRVTGVAGDDRSNVAELEAWGPAEGAAEVRWLVADHLGTPRMVVDRTGSLAGIKRHDYLPFGEEVGAGTGGRTTTQGYIPSDNVRQQFTGVERDTETELDFAQARYYAKGQGRFINPDPLSGEPTQPQSWNRYTYTLNNPLRYVDLEGLRWVQRSLGEGRTQYGWCDNEDCYNNAINSSREGWEGWEAVSFDETQPYNIAYGPGSGGDRYDSYLLHPDGIVECTSCASVTTDWGAQFAIGGILRGVGSLFSGIAGGVAKAIHRQAATETVAGMYGEVSVATLESAAAAEGPTVQVITNLTQAPQAGRTLSVSVGAGAQALSNAARSEGQTYVAQIPRALLEQMKRSGLAIESTTTMGKATATEIQFMPQATRFITKFFSEQK